MPKGVCGFSSPVVTCRALQVRLPYGAVVVAPSRCEKKKTKRSEGAVMAQDPSGRSRRTMVGRQRRPFALSVVVFFALINVGGLIAIYRALRTEERTFTVKSVSALGEVEVDHIVHVVFDREIGPSRSTASADVSQGLVEADDGLLTLLVETVAGTVTPDEVPLAGAVTWADPRTLVFRPRERLPRATPLRLVVSSGIARAAGWTLEGETTYRFHTTRPRLVEVRQTSYSTGLHATLSLVFNDVVAAVELQRHLELVDDDGGLLRFTVLGEEPARDLRIRTLEPVRSLRLRLREGLRGAAGILGLEDTVERGVELTQRLRLTSVTSEAAGRSWPRVHVEFNNSIDRGVVGRLGDFFRVEPAVDFTASISWSSRVRLSGDFQPGRVYTVIAERGLPGRGGTVLVEDESRRVTIPDRRPLVSFAEWRGFLSPQGHRRLALTTSNVAGVKVVAHRVLPNNLVHYMIRGIGSSAHRSFTRRGEERILEIDSPKNELVETAIELDDLIGADLTGDERTGIWYVEAASVPDAKVRAASLVAVTDLALTTKTSGDGYVIWATSIRTGEPVVGARISMWSGNRQMLAFGFTDADGLLRFDGPFDGVDGKPFAVVAEKDEQLSYLHLQQHEVPLSSFDVGGLAYLHRGYEAFVYSDRGVYRPGDTIHLEGIVRDAELEAPGSFPVEIEVLRPDLERVALIAARVRESGGVSADFELPGSARTGAYLAKLRLPGGATGGVTQRELGRLRFSVEDFVPRRLRLSARVVDDPAASPVDESSIDGGAPSSPRRCFTGDPLTVLVRGEYLAGLPAAGARASLRWTMSQGSFHFDGDRRFRFGDSSRDAVRLAGSAGSLELDRNGEARFELSVPSARSSMPLVLRVEASVDDVSGRAVRSAFELDVDSSPFYVGIRRLFTRAPQPGVPARFECVVLDTGGDPMPIDRLEVIVSHVEWSTVLEETSSGRYRHVSHREVREVSRHAVPLEEGRGRVEVAFPGHGSYEVAVVEKGSGMRALDTLWVSGNGWRGSRSLEKPEELELEILSELVRPGDEVRVLVRAPFAGTLLLSTETDRVLDVRVVRLQESHSVQTVRVPQNVSGNIYVAGSIVRGVDASKPWAPHRAYGVVPLCVDFSRRHLTVTVETPGRLRPGSEGAVLVKVASVDGSPRRAEVSLALVDEGILSWTDHPTPRPYTRFYDKRAHSVPLADVYGSLLREVPLEMRRARPGGGKTGGRPGSSVGDLDEARRLSPVRSGRVHSTVLWLGTFDSGDDGTILETFDLPAFTGELRVMAVAHDGPLFGSGEDRVEVRAPLHVELGLPRFLAPGDEIVSPARIFNDTEVSGVAAIEWELDGPIQRSTRAAPDLAFASLPAKEVSIENGDSARVFQGFGALDEIGSATVRLRARLGDTEFVEEVEVPVRPAAPLVVDSSSGSITARSPFDRTFADELLAGTAKHRLVLSPVPDIELLGSLGYLLRYPHGCLEQTTSRAFPLLYLRDLAGLIDDRHGGGSSGVVDNEQRIDAYLHAGIDRLRSFLARDGWMYMWPGARRAWVWGTVYAAHFLVEARRLGHDVPQEELERILDTLEESLARGESGTASGLERAYAIYVLAQAGRTEGLAGVIEALLAQRPEVVAGAENGDSAGVDRTAEARFLLAASWMALNEIGRARAALGEQIPAPEVARDRAGVLRSPARQSALLLSTLLDVAPSSPWVASLVTRLKGLRVGGRWGTTQENAFALLALGKYAKLRRARGSSYTATVRVDGEDPITIAATDAHTLEEDLTGKRVRVDLEGPGTLYWFLVEEGVPTGVDVDDIDSGLQVRRRYLDARGEDISGRAVRQGEILQVEILVTTNRSLRNLVITDLLPAGLEVENPRLVGGLAVAGSRQTATVSSGATRTSKALDVVHLELRDDRVLVHSSGIESGTSVFRYAARAVTRGDFRIPMIAAESMYDPGVYSRHGAGRMVIAAAPADASSR